MNYKHNAYTYCETKQTKWIKLNNVLILITEFLTPLSLGVVSFRGARNMKRLGFETVYFLDNGGYPDLKEIEGFQSTVNLN